MIIKGTIEGFENFYSKHVDHRNVVVWLPPGYRPEAERLYPVLYMHDGQNLFDNPASFGGESADISARYAETATIPRFVSRFYAKYAGRLVYGTDMGYDRKMYKITFRVLESLDEHFYEIEQFGYHWSMNGFGLTDAVLKKVYRNNAMKILNNHPRP